MAGGDGSHESHNICSLLLNMLHTKFGQDTHSSFIKDAENVEMLFAVRTAIDKYNWLFCQFSHS